MIEVEYRARYDRKTHDRLRRFLMANGRDCGDDDKTAWMFLLPNGILKVVDETSHDRAKISYKAGRIHRRSALSETEIPIDRSQVSTFVRMFKDMGLSLDFTFQQRRQNFRYRGIDIALKYSRAWGYHAEFEQLIRRTSDVPRARKTIAAAAKALGLKLMTVADVAKFTAKYARDHRTKK